MELDDFDGPTLMDMVEQVADPKMAVPGLMVVEGDDLPPDDELGRKARMKLLTPAGHLKPSVLKPRRVVVVDGSRPDLVPEALKEPGQRRREWIEGCKSDITVNLLNPPEDADLGETIRDYLLEDEEIHNPDYYDAGGEDSDETISIPGYYDSADDNEPRPGEQRAWVVVAGS